MPNFGELLYTVPDDLKSLFRSLEKISKKIIMSKWSLKFNRTCLTENILPKYSNFKNHDPAVARSKTTLDYRKYLVNREIKLQESKLSSMNLEKDTLEKKIEEFQYEVESKNRIKNHLNLALTNLDTAEKTKIVKKLNNLYNGQIVIKDESKSFLNLSNYQLSPIEEEFLNLGLNFHIQSKYNKLHKHVQMELLYQNLEKLEKDQKIDMNPRMKELMSAEATKHRNEKTPKYNNPRIESCCKKVKKQ